MCSVHDGTHSFRLFFVLPLVIVRREVLSSITPSTFLGIAPQDQEYFASELIESFPKVRLKDGFCDFPDGTDEPGTSACPESKFYRMNAGDKPRILFSSQVNDQICGLRIAAAVEFVLAASMITYCLPLANQVKKKAFSVEKLVAGFSRVSRRIWYTSYIYLS